MAKEDGVISRKAGALLLLIAVCLGLPAIGMHWTDDAKRSRWENRELAAFPRLIGAGSERSGFFQGLETWIDDHFAFALPLNRLYRQMVFYVFSDSPSEQVTLGKDGFVFLNSHVPGTPNPALRRLCDVTIVNQDYPALASAWVRILRHFERPGRNVVLAVAPTTPVVYPDMLPDSTPPAIRKACAAYRQAPPPVSRLVTDMREQGLRAVYPLETFIANRLDGNFFPKQCFHFSGLSAHLFGETLLKTVGIDPPAAWKTRIEDGQRRGDMEELFGFRREVHSPDFDYSHFGMQVAYQQPASIKEC
jgi:hypothetical protein